MFVVVSACGSGPGLAGSELPRTTATGIHLSVEVSEELLPLMGCHTSWYMSHDGEQPPPGACEKMTTVRRFVASGGSDEVEARIVGEPSLDTIYGMVVAGWGDGQDMTVAVVLPPPDATEIRMMDSSGSVLDRVVPGRGLVALSGMASDVVVEAVDGMGAVIAACSRRGVIIDDVVYACTLAPGITPPITTIP